MIAAITVLVIALVAVAWVEVPRWLYRRRVAKAIALVQTENPDFDAQAAQCLLERDRQRNHGARDDDDRDDFSGPSMLMAA